MRVWMAGGDRPALRQLGDDPQTWLADVLDRIVSGRTKVNALRELLPWNWRAASGIDRLAPGIAAAA